MLEIRDILVQIRIRGSIPLTNGFGTGSGAGCNSFLQRRLKVPKCEIFDRSDFPDFYTIKSRREGDFGENKKNFKQIFRGPFGAAKFLMRMLSIILRSAFPSKHAEHTHQGLMRTLSIRVRN